jgi:hypothetical protein
MVVRDGLAFRQRLDRLRVGLRLPGLSRVARQPLAKGGHLGDDPLAPLAGPGDADDGPGILFRQRLQSNENGPGFFGRALCLWRDLWRCRQAAGRAPTTTAASHDWLAARQYRSSARTSSSERENTLFIIPFLPSIELLFGQSAILPRRELHRRAIASRQS